MPPLEIERKFLIYRSKELFEKCSLRIDITQTYLIKTRRDIQRRVRSMTQNGCTRYYYTEKRFISAAVREECEREISGEEYKELLKERDESLLPIEKVRHILVFRSQRFEIDCYPFSDTLATMELELSGEDDEIVFPDFVHVIKEVTGDKAYSNAALALNAAFPEG